MGNKVDRIRESITLFASSILQMGTSYLVGKGHIIYTLFRFQCTNSPRDCKMIYNNYCRSDQFSNIVNTIQFNVAETVSFFVLLSSCVVYDSVDPLSLLSQSRLQTLQSLGQIQHNFRLLPPQSAYSHIFLGSCTQRIISPLFWRQSCACSEPHMIASTMMCAIANKDVPWNEVGFICYFLNIIC